MSDFSSFDPSNPNVVYTITSDWSSLNYPTTYTFFSDGSKFSIGPDLHAIYEKADKEFDALEDQTSIARQMLNDIGITWNDKE